MKRSASLAALLLCLTAQPALAEYPERPITMIVPAAAGGNADITARLVGQEMRELAVGLELGPQFPSPSHSLPPRSESPVAFPHPQHCCCTCIAAYEHTRRL